MTVRWTFNDPVAGTSYTFPINPNEMSSPLEEHTVSPVPATPLQGGSGVRRRSRPTEWTFSNVLYFLGEQAAMRQWQTKGHRVHLTDHFGRTFEVVVTNFEATPAPWRRYPERHKYTMTCLVYGRV